MDLTIHFTFSGKEQRAALITIADGALSVSEGPAEKADLRVRADSETWLGILNEMVSPITAMLRGKMKLKGNPRVLTAFKRCVL